MHLMRTHFRHGTLYICEIKTTTNAISNQNEQKKGVYADVDDGGGGGGGGGGNDNNNSGVCMYVFKCKAHTNQTTKSVSTVAER